MRREYLKDVQIEALARLKAYNCLPPIAELEKRYDITKWLMSKYRDEIKLAGEKYRQEIYERAIRLVQIKAKESEILEKLKISKTTLNNYKKRAREEGVLSITSRAGINTREVHANTERFKKLSQSQGS